MFFMFTLPKISMILQKMKICLKCDIHHFCTKPFDYHPTYTAYKRQVFLILITFE